MDDFAIIIFSRYYTLMSLCVTDSSRPMTCDTYSHPLHLFNYHHILRYNIPTKLVKVEYLCGSWVGMYMYVVDFTNTQNRHIHITANLLDHTSFSMHPLFDS